jgi:hypothetical protein
MHGENLHPMLTTNLGLHLLIFCQGLTLPSVKFAPLELRLRRLSYSGQDSLLEIFRAMPLPEGGGTIFDMARSREGLL